MLKAGRRTAILIPFVLLMTACGGGSAEENADVRRSPLPRTPAPATAGTQAPAGTPAYTLPDGWERVAPASSMRVEEFRLPGIEGAAPAELAVFHFPGTGGSVQANVDRWIGQFTQPDGRPSSEAATTSKRTNGATEVTIVDVIGTYNPGMMAGSGGPLPRYRMLAAIIETRDGPWFYKLTGPEATVARWESSFDTFAASLRLP